MLAQSFFSLVERAFLHHRPKVKLSGRCKDDESKKHVASQLKSAMNTTLPQFDLKTGQIKQKKVPKEKSPAELAIKDLKAMSNKPHGWGTSYVEHTVCLFCSCIPVTGYFDILYYPRVAKMETDRPQLLEDFTTFGVRNCSELVTCAYNLEQYMGFNDVISFPNNAMHENIS